MARQLSYVYGLTSSPFVYSTIPDIIVQKSQQMPETEAFVYFRPDKSRESITYKKLHEESQKVAEFLINIGTMKGDTIGLLGSNSINRLVGEFGIIMTGGVVVHISPTLKDTSDIVELFSATDSKCLVIDPGEEDGLHQVIDTTLKHEMIVKSKVLLLRASKKFASYCTFDWKTSQRQIGIPLPVLDPEDPVVIFCTSGSTGKPKLVEHSHFNMANQKLPVHNDRNECSKVYNDRPFGWGAGSPLWGIHVWDTRVFLDSRVALQKEYAQTIWDIIEKEKCGYAFIMPYTIYDLDSIYERNRSIFRVANLLTAGQIISDKLSKITGKIAENVHIVFGTTETFNITCKEFLPNVETLSLGCVGYPLSGIEIKIINEDEETMERGDGGEICVRSTKIFHKYVNDRYSTARAYSRSGWFKTGDIGYISSYGQITIQGRKKLRISRGTRKIFSEVIEHHISQMAGIKKVIVVAVPDERLFEEVCVCFVPMADFTVDQQKVEEYCTETFLKENTMDSLSDMPKYYLQFSSFPELSNGKPDRHMIKTEAERRVLAC